MGLVLDNAGATEEEEVGTLVLEEREVRPEFDCLFEILALRPFRFDPATMERHYLGWSCFVR